MMFGASFQDELDGDVCFILENGDAIYASSETIRRNSKPLAKRLEAQFIQRKTKVLRMGTGRRLHHIIAIRGDPDAFALACDLLHNTSKIDISLCSPQTICHLCWISNTYGLRKAMLQHVEHWISQTEIACQIEPPSFGTRDTLATSPASIHSARLWILCIAYWLRHAHWFKIASRDLSSTREISPTDLHDHEAIMMLPFGFKFVEMLGRSWDLLHSATSAIIREHFDPVLNFASAAIHSRDIEALKEPIGNRQTSKKHEILKNISMWVQAFTSQGVDGEITVVQAKQFLQEQRQNDDNVGISFKDPITGHVQDLSQLLNDALDDLQELYSSAGWSLEVVEGVIARLSEAATPCHFRPAAGSTALSSSAARDKPRDTVARRVRFSEAVSPPPKSPNASLAPLKGVLKKSCH